MTTHVTLSAAAESTDAARRTITGRIVSYDTPAPSSPPSVFATGSLRWADDVRRVKLLVDHDPAQPVGYAQQITDHGGHVTATFYVPETPEGDRALAQAANGLRDGLSVGVWADDDGATYDTDTGYLHITAGTLRETSLCALPAQDHARVSDVAATTTKEQQHMPENTQPEQPAAPAPAATQPVNAAGTQQPEQQPAPAVVTAQAPPVTVNAAGARITVRQAAQVAAQVVARGGSASDVRAALNDVTPASLPGTDAAGMEDPFLRDVFLGELWSASKTDRPMIDLLGTPRPITGLKVYGWKWEVKPEVGDYAGNKADVPTNAPKIVPAEASVERTAGGWDVDRIYVDLGDASLIEALWAAAVEDYRAKTEAKVVAALVAAATAGGDSASLPAALVSIGQTASALGANIGGLALAGDVWGAFANLTRDQVPWWLGSGDSINLGTTSGTVGGTRVFVEPTLAAGSYLAVDPRAATYYEKNPPVRVNAVDLPRGGVDLGLFGYHGLIVNDARAIISGTVGAPAGE